MPENEKTTASNGAAATATATNEAENSTAFSVSKEDWDKLQGMVKALSPLAAKLRQENKEATKPAQTTTQAVTDDEPRTQKEKLEEIARQLKEQREAIENEKKAANLRLKTSGMKSAIANLGITDPDAAEIFFDHVERRYGSKIQADGEAVIYTDDLGDSKDIGAFLGEILKSPKGKFFKPEKAALPSTRAGRGTSATLPGQKSVMEMSRDELLKLPIAEQQRLFAEEARARGLKI